jgi:hypothetical protein
MDETVITGLPDKLRVVPPSPSGPDDPQRHVARKRVMDWRSGVLAYGEARRAVCMVDPAQQAIELEKCRNDRAYFLAIWCVLYEPRRRKAGAKEPRFIPFEKQVQMSRLLDDCLDGEEGPLQDAAISKCRAVGATWVFSAYAVHDWLFVPGSSIGVLSRNEYYVDSKAMKSVFAKIRFLIRHLPTWMLPKQYDINKLLLLNHDNGNEIWGESTTTNSARGSRATWILVDEAAFIKGFGHVWAGTANAADTRIALSTESFDEGPDFRDLWKGKNGATDTPRVMEVDWWDNPFFDDKWYTDMKSRMANTPNEFAIEVERNPYAGSEVFIYPEAREARPHSDYRYQDGLPLIASLDPGKRDDFAVLLLQDDPVNGTVNVVDGYSISGRPADYFGTLLTGTPDPHTFYGDFGYDGEALRIMDFLNGKKLSEVYGDVAGRTEEGRLMQSTYDVLAEYGIEVIFDRTAENEVAQSKRRLRGHKGRHEATHALWPRLRFADTPGAIRALDAISKYRYGRQSGGSENPTPQHDEHSHFATALEYYAVNRAWYATINALELKAPTVLSKRRNWLKTPRRLPTLEAAIA